MQRYALLDVDGLVANVITADGGYTPPTGFTLLPVTEDSPIGPGWTVDGDSVTAPPDVIPVPPPPTHIEQLQAQVDELTDLLLGGL